MTVATIAVFRRVFPELSWLSDTDWKTVCGYVDWDNPDDTRSWVKALDSRAVRVTIRSDVRAYFGEANVPNINDPSGATWA